MKTVPSSVRIGGKRIRIVMSSNMEDYGEYDHDKAEIRLSTKAMVKQSDLRETLRHEMMHAAMAISGVAFSERFEEEALVRCFEEIFFPAWDALREKHNL